MRNLVLLLFAMLLINVSIAQVTGTYDTQRSNFTFEKDGTYDIILGDNALFTEQIGAPQLPVIIKQYLLPAGSALTGLNIGTTHKSQLKDEFYIYPAQPPCPINGEPCPDFVEPDSAIYNSTTAFPADIVEIVSDNYTFGYHIVTVKICPFEYIPANKILKLYTHISFDINYSSGDIELTEKITERRHNIARNYVSSLVENPADINAIDKTAKIKLPSSTSTDKLILHTQPSDYGDVPDYIIITNEELKPNFEQFAEYKTKKGIPTLIVTVEEIYQNYPGCDNAEKIRNYLKSTHHYWGDALFVLLGGDTEIVPARFGTNDGNSTNLKLKVTDMYYCDVYKPGNPDYNWNADGDSYFGWDDESLELGPDNFIGRAPADNINEADNFINKIISYENLSDVSDYSYINNLLFLGAYHFYEHPTYGTWAQGQWWHHTLWHESFLDLSRLNKLRLFDDYIPLSPPYNTYPGDEELGKDITLNYMSNGHGTLGKFHFVSHYDHGGPFGIGLSSGMKHQSAYCSDMDGLSNGSYYQIMYTTACKPGEFEKDCFAEHYINAVNGGGVAIIANSGYGYSSNYNQDKELFKSIYETDGGNIMGIAFEKARDAIYYDHKKRKRLTLFGEPTMEMWTDAPQSISLNVPANISIQNGVNNELNVTINALSENALITLYKYNSITNEIEIFAERILLSGNTSATFILNPDIEGELFVKATAKNYLPATASVNIQMPEAHLYVTETSFTDANGNGQIEQGESIILNIQLTNSGGANITGVTANLSANTSFVNIVNSQATYSTINAGSSAQLTGYTFDMLVTEEIPPYIEFTLDITGSGSFSHTDNFYLELSSPKIETGNRLTTNTGGNPIDDFIVDEDVYVYIDLSNIGNVNASGLTAELTTTLDPSIVNISTATQTYPDINVFETKTNTNPFVFRLLQTHTGDMPFTLTITNAYGKEWIYDFNMKESMAGLLISDFDFSSGKDNITLTWAAPAGSFKGYNIYRSETETGTYEKVNDFIVSGTSMYHDVSVAELSEYYYKISVVTNTGNELSKDDLIANWAWTSLARQDGFPITANSSAASGALSSPTVYDVDGDGTKEIFLNYTNNRDGRIMAFYESGQEMFNIDGNETEVWGFAETEYKLWSNPAVGDLENDGIAEVFSAAREPGNLYGFQSIDGDADGRPDILWDDGVITTEQNNWLYRNPVLADINSDGFLEIIILSEQQKLYVYDKDKNLLWSEKVGNKWYSLGEPAVADIDGDGYMEIVVGFADINENTRGGIYIWNHNGTPFNGSNPFKQFAVSERADNGCVLADIDNDNELEILTITHTGSTGKVYAFNIDGTPVNSNWNGTYTIVNNNGSFISPRIAVGDLNNDGNLEIAFGSQDKLHVLDNNGNVLSGFPKNVGNCGDGVPILADIDDDNDIEIIINADGVIYAFNPDGTECVGWRLETDNDAGFAGSPYIGDIDNEEDGYNEIVISSTDCATYVWKTTGDADKIEWGSYRADAQNTGVYKSGECIFSEIYTVEIDENTVWNTDKHIRGNLIINENSELTIYSKVTFTEESKVIINPGAKLIINGGTLTNKCGGMWQGIIVKGNKYQSQLPESNQGVLEINNEAVIEHARRAVYVGNPDAPWDNNAGGIVKINGAVFRDNIACVEIPSYRNGLANNRSYIVNSTFETTDFLANINEHPWAFISLWNVGIININGNTFINQNPDAYAFNERGKGLKSSDADFYLKPLLIFPGPVLSKNRFENLYKAVETENTGRLSVCDIDNNEFVNNYYSVYVNSVDNANIVSNTFNADWQYAELYLTQSNGFHIENNDFIGQSDGYGIWISDSPGENEIYRNRFNNNEYGIITMYDNTSLTGGLQLLCNTFTDNIQHIRVINPPGISNNQGSESFSAGNQFYPECNNGTGDIDNGGNQINYFAEYGLEYEPLCNTNVNIFKADHNACPSKLNNQIPPGQITTLNDSINTVKTELTIVTDGGDTEGTTEDVENAEPDEALKLRNTLLEKSPNLSDTVMVSSATVEDVLPSIMVKQVLASNPGAAKSDNVQNALDNRQNQLPQYMRDEINLGKDSLSHKEKLESKLSAFSNERENLINRKITRLLLDTTEQSLDTIENLLTSENNLHRMYQLINFYISQNRIQDAQTLFADIPQNFDLSNSLQTEYEKNAQFYNIKFVLKNAEKSWFEMNNEQKALIHTLAEDSTTHVGMLARAVLSLIENKDYGYPISAVEEGGNKNANPAPEILTETFSVYPETAKDYFIIEYALAEKETPKDVKIVVFDNAGNEMINFDVKTQANQFLTECENWKEGTYWCRKIYKGKIVAVEKVIITSDYFENKNNKKTSDINNSEQTNFFDIYPNPAKEYVFVTFTIEKANPGKTVLQITDSKGSTVKIIKLNKSENRIKISISDFKKGVYTICLKTGEKIINTKKIVVK